MALYFYGSTVCQCGILGLLFPGVGGRKLSVGGLSGRAHCSHLGSCCHSLRGHSDGHMRVMTGKQLPAPVWVFVCLHSWPLLLPSSRWLCTKVVPGLRVSVAVSGAPYLGKTDLPVHKISGRFNCPSLTHTHQTRPHIPLSLLYSHSFPPFCFADCHVEILILTLECS